MNNITKSYIRKQRKRRHFYHGKLFVPPDPRHVKIKVSLKAYNENPIWKLEYDIVSQHKVKYHQQQFLMLSPKSNLDAAKHTVNLLQDLPA